MINEDDVKNIEFQEPSNKKYLIIGAIILVIVVAAFFLMQENKPSEEELSTVIDTADDWFYEKYSELRAREKSPFEYKYEHVSEIYEKDMEIISDFEEIFTNQSNYKQACGENCIIEKADNEFIIKRPVNDYSWTANYTFVPNKSEFILDKSIELYKEVVKSKISSRKARKDLFSWARKRANNLEEDCPSAQMSSDLVAVSIRIENEIVTAEKMIKNQLEQEMNSINFNKDSLLKLEINEIKKRIEANITNIALVKLREIYQKIIGKIDSANSVENFEQVDMSDVFTTKMLKTINSCREKSNIKQLEEIYVQGRYNDFFEKYGNDKFFEAVEFALPVYGYEKFKGVL